MPARGPRDNQLRAVWIELLRSFRRQAVTDDSCVPFLLRRNVADEDGLILTPGPMDILLGKGKRGNKFPGNALLRKLWEDNAHVYKKADRFEKTRIAERILTDLQHAGWNKHRPRSDNKLNPFSQKVRPRWHTSSPCLLSTLV